MAQKKKSTKPQASAPSAEEIASRLSDAQERMGTVAQQAEQRSEQTRAQLREREESAQARMSESERQRSEAAQAAKSVAERKLAQLSYAESYRERMQSERAKARKQKEAEEARARAEAEARAKAEESAKAARKKAIATQLCELIGEYGKLECPELEGAFKVTEEDIDGFIQSMSDVFGLIKSFQHFDLNKLAAPIMKSDDDILRDYIAKILG